MKEIHQLTTFGSYLTTLTEQVRTHGSEGVHPIEDQPSKTFGFWSADGCWMLATENVKSDSPLLLFFDICGAFTEGEKLREQDHAS